MAPYIDIHTHQLYTDDTLSVYNDVLTSDNQNRYVSIGLHPCSNTQHDQLQELELLCQTNPAMIAIGECGLDKLCGTDWELQVKIFTHQIQLSKKYNKPLIIHCVKAFQECLALLKNHPQPVIFHGFTKHPNVAQQIVASGHYISLGPNLFKQSDRIQKLLEVIPFDKLFLETDNATIAIQEVYNFYCSAAEIELQLLKEQMCKNFLSIFVSSIK